ncbi:GGDEF domain-containing protein [Phyllobacterium myrsinacearum]|uniref:diguanylate cyclase n=1 Tax=Phyllobacterium myrsinacearum TaxID=28101 RepID=A0A839EGS6_9HYPH|nr:GGDEF domain-containing protein [Phyllobacterium myrsinacearum]MBA8877959.1 diguanylate cyclase (GGDEF)-like protein [Phyllobacterium myrsinacearum]
MSGAGFILAMNLFMSGIFATAFFMIGLYDRKNVAAHFFALAYALGMLNFAIEFLIPSLADARVAVFLAFAVLIVAMLIFTAGIAQRYAKAIPWTLFSAVLVGSIIANQLSEDMPRQSIVRMSIYQGPYAIIFALCALFVLRSSLRSGFDRALMVLFALNAAHFLSKPFLAAVLGGMGDSPQSYISTQYALLSQSASAVLSVATAILLLTILTRNILANISSVSETDVLSSLLNRRGFEGRARAALTRAQHLGNPISLIICDLDYFKQINDSHGHGTGDKVIAGFAAILRAVSDQEKVVARIGGEEFAVLLPGSISQAARQYAEDVRQAFAGFELAELAGGQSLTASFGIAESQSGEGLSSMMRRADHALYEAKKAGRNCVRIAANDLPETGTENVQRLEG